MLTNERKQELIATYKINEQDTGSPEVQIAILTEKIRYLTEHLKVHKKITIHVVVCWKWLDNVEVC